MQFFTNHIGHFMLVTGLLDAAHRARPRGDAEQRRPHRAPRKGASSSTTSWGEGVQWRANYGQSKLANLLFAKELARRFNGTKKTANAVHPGVIKTNLARSMNPVVAIALTIAGPFGLKNVGQGAATEVYVATSPQLANVSGQYFADCNVATPRRDANDEAMAKKLWDVSRRSSPNCRPKLAGLADDLDRNGLIRGEPMTVFLGRSM